MKLIVGLGNFGPKYRGTRHNLGFEVVEEVAARRRAAFEPSSVAEALVARVLQDPLSVGARATASTLLLAKPLTYVNASGEAVGGLMRYFRIDETDLFVVADDANLPFGRLRARPHGSAGGHNGFRSIIDHVGPDFARLRVGIGRGGLERDLKDHVLARFDAEEKVRIGSIVARAADAVDLFVAEGIAAVMNRYNGGEAPEEAEADPRA